MADSGTLSSSVVLVSRDSDRDDPSDEDDKDDHNDSGKDKNEDRDGEDDDRRDDDRDDDDDDRRDDDRDGDDDDRRDDDRDDDDDDRRDDDRDDDDDRRDDDNDGDDGDRDDDDDDDDDHDGKNKKDKDNDDDEDDDDRRDGKNKKDEDDDEDDKDDGEDGDDDKDDGDDDKGDKKHGRTDWIDHVKLPEYAQSFYQTIVTGSDNDGLDRTLISDDYNTVDTTISESSSAVVGSVWIFEDELELFTAQAGSDGVLDPLLLTDDRFSAIDASAGDKAIDFAALQAGDIVQTSSFNGIYITKLLKDGNPFYEDDLKNTCAAISTAFFIFDRDHPEVFWLSGKNKVRIITARSNAAANSEAYLFFMLADSDGFTVRDPNYPQQSDIEEGIRQRDQAVAAILSSVSGSRYDQVAALDRWLTEHNEFNTSEDLYDIGNDPHECISALTGRTGTDGPVCDGYSRAFKVLCDQLDIPCLLVDGYTQATSQSGEVAHMWNSVQMEDGLWYAVDVTWDDPSVSGGAGAVSGRETVKYLLIGSSTEVDGIPFSVSHRVTEHSAEDMTQLPDGLQIHVTAYAPLSAVGTGLPFADIAAGSWYFDAVRSVYENGLMSGAGNGLFCPDSNVSRAQVVQILYNKAGKPGTSGGISFADISPDTWYADAAAWAVSNEIAGGYGGGRFGPEDDITREQFAVMLWRYAGSPAAEKELDAPDAGQVSAFALEALRWAVENGIVNGNSSGLLDPTGQATRAQVAQMFKNYLK